MTYVSLPFEAERDVTFYLAMEEYLARKRQREGKTNEEDLFFMWQVVPSVIFGRNQVIEREVNRAYCSEHGIRVFRRKSGGGCVYADKNNIMMSYITHAGTVATTFQQYVETVAGVLRALGVPAEASGRNDVMIEGRKVSGNAFYHVAGQSIVHGTMLYDTNMQHMVGAITPSQQKLVSKGVESVRQHVALLKDWLSMSIDEFLTEVRQRLCGTEELRLDEADVAAIEELEKEYRSEAFIIGSNPAYTCTKRERVEGVGELELRMEVRGGVIRQINILGDFFLLGDLDGQILKPLRGTPLQHDAVEKVLPDRVDKIVMGLQKSQLVSLLTSNL